MGAPEVTQYILNLLPEHIEGPRFTVIGVGGAGINVLNTVGGDADLRKVAVDTDEYFLALCRHEDQLDIGLPQLGGRGTRGSVELGRSCAQAHEAEILDILEGDIVLLTAGLGRGTGTGATPAIAQVAQGKGIPVIAILVWPFEAENLARRAEEGLESLRRQCNGVMILDNDAALEVSEGADRREAAMVVNDMIAQMIETLIGRVQEAFPFSVHDEIADFVEALPGVNAELVLRAAELSFDATARQPVAMDGRGRINLR